MLAAALWIASMAAPATTGNAPASLAGHVLQYHLSEGTGIYTQDKGQDFLTSFSTDGQYADSELGGIVTDEGGYTYRVTGANTSQVTYHPSTESAQQVGGDYTERFVFQTPTSGTVSASASTASGIYKGVFVIKQ